MIICVSNPCKPTMSYI